MQLLGFIAAFVRRHWRAYVAAALMLVGIAVMTVLIPRRVGHIIDGLVAGNLAGGALWREIVLLLGMGAAIYLLRVGWRLELFSAAFRLGIPAADLAVICQRAENAYVGVQCGIMDQFASALGRTGEALHVWCDTAEYEQIPMRDAVLIFDTAVPRSLRGSQYNTRRAERDAALARLRELEPSLPSLAAATPERTADGFFSWTPPYPCFIERISFDVADLVLDLVYLERDGFRLELLAYPIPGATGDGRPRPMNALGFTHLSFRVDDADALAGAVVAHGGQLLADRTVVFGGGNRGLMLTDPDGNLLEFMIYP